MLFKNRKYALLLATLAGACAIGHTNSDRELLVGTRSQSKEVLSLLGNFGKILKKDKDSGMFVVALKSGISADSAIKELKSCKEVRVALPESARKPDTSNFYALDNYVRYIDYSASLKGDKDEDKGNDKLDFYAALRYYLRGRVDGNGVIDQKANRAARDHRNMMPTVHLGPTRPAQPGTIGSSWSFIGPNNTTFPYQQYFGQQTVSGRISAIAVDPTDASIIYTASGGGGLWKSTNGGTSWTCISDKAPWIYPSVCSIAIDPQNHLTIYAGTGDYDGFFQGYNQGIMKSTDGGNTWENLAANVVGIYNLCVSHIIVDPNNREVITITTGRGSYAATYEGTGNIFQSRDGGFTWTSAGLASADFCALDISAPDSKGNRTYWAGSCLSPGTNPASLYKSTNQGLSWTAVTSLTTATTSSWSLATSKVSSSTLYVLLTGNQQIYKSINGGTSWTSINTATFPNMSPAADNNWGQSNYDYDIMAYAAPNAPAKEVIFVGLLTLAYSTDGGTTWTDYGQSMNPTTVLHSDQHQLAINPKDPTQVLAGCDGGLFKLSVSWNGATPTINQTSLNGGLNITQLYAVGPNPSNANQVLTGAQDNASPSQLTSTTNWANPGGGDGGYCGWNDPYSYFFTCSDQGSVQFYDFTGNPQGAPSSGFQNDPNVAFITPTVLSETGKYLFLATNVLLTVDGTNINAGSYTTGTTTLSQTGFVNTIGTAPTSDAVLYAGSSDGEIWRSANTGTSFTEIDQPNQPGANYSLGAISVSTTNANDVVVGYQNTGITHLWRCTDTSAATPVWTSVSGSGSASLPDAPINALARDSANPATTWYAGTDVGVFMTTNAGSTWSNVNDNLPQVQVFDLKVVGTNLYVATFGRGVWKISLNSPAVSISGFSVSAKFASPQTSPVGTVTLSSAAPSGGTYFELSSSNTSIAQVPASGSVAAGRTSGTFNVINQYVATSTNVTLTATVNGTSQSVLYTVNPPVPTYIYAVATTIKGGQGILCGLQLTGNAPPAGAVITLTSSNTLVATVPPTMTIGGGARRANFVITTKSTLVQLQPQITATYGGQSVSVTVTVTP